MAYTAPAWRDFAVTIGGLSGALTGLLFVAVSLHSGALARSRPLASRAAQTLVLFLTPAISAVVLAAPLPSTALGAVLLAVAAVSGVTLLWLDRRPGTICRRRAAPPATLTVALRTTAVPGQDPRLTRIPG